MKEFKSFAELKEHYRQVAQRLPPRENRQPTLPPATVVEEIKPVAVPEPKPEPAPAPVPEPSRLPTWRVDRIKAVVCNHFQIHMDELCSDRRFGRFVRPRHYAMFLVKEATNASWPQVGRWFGNRDHTTAINAVRKVERQIKTDPDVARLIDELRERSKQ